jgi:hypothetical protein
MPCYTDNTPKGEAGTYSTREDQKSIDDIVSLEAAARNRHRTKLGT